jgi:hypothetical protein
MGIRKVLPADTGGPAGKLYPGDKFSRSHPHHGHMSPPRDDGAGIKPLRNTEGGPVERLKPGDDPRVAIGRLYREGRTYPHGKPHDYQARETVPKFRGTAPDESQPQIANDQPVHLNDTREGWVRGMGSEAPYPKFDSGPSGNRYRK